MKIKANIRIKDDMYTVSLNWKIGTRTVNQKKKQPACKIHRRNTKMYGWQNCHYDNESLAALVHAFDIKSDENY